METEGAGGVTYALEGRPDGILFDTQSLKVSGTPARPVIQPTRLTYVATDTAGNTVSLLFTATVTAVSTPVRLTTDGENNPILVDGAGNAVQFYGV